MHVHEYSIDMDTESRFDRKDDLVSSGREPSNKMDSKFCKFWLTHAPMERAIYRILEMI